MIFILWIAEVLNFSHGKLSNSKQTLSWGNLISETKTDLSSCKRHSSIIEFDQSFEIDKDTLCSFWSQISLHLASRTNLRVKHKIKWFRLCELISCVSVSNLILEYDGINLFRSKIINIFIKFLKLFNLLGLFLLSKFRYFLGNEFLNQFISASWCSCFYIFYHQILKLIYVTRCLQYIRESKIRASNFEHIFFKNKVTPPHLFDVILYCTSQRTVVIKSWHAAIDLKRLGCKELSLQKVFDVFSLIFLSQCLLSKMGEIQRLYLHQLHSVWPRPYFVVYELKTSVYCRYSAIM